MPDLVLFDCDGVLVDSEPVSNRLLAEHLTAIGLPTSLQDSYDAYLGRSMRSNLETIEQRLGRPVPAGFVDGYHAAVHRELAHVRAVDGIHEALDALDAAGTPTAVASSGDHAKLAVTLGATGLADRFAGRVFSATEVEHGKPAPDLFLHAASRLGAEPARCVVVEDAPAGVAAARAAGMRVIAYAGLTPADRLAGADAIVTRMADLPAALGR